ncbi:MAG: arginine--tRNA ligase [Spirochaetota bacterium]
MNYHELWTGHIKAALNEAASKKGIALDTVELPALETPPEQAMGDLAMPMFPFAKIFRGNPAAIASEVATELEARTDSDRDGTVEAAGPYLNIRLPRSAFAAATLSRALAEGASYGANKLLEGERITIEFSSPNTNKPLHLGHLRNDALGESLRRILMACGADVRAVNLINDRGIHICKSMLAYQKFGNEETPESSGLKGDHLVGKYYVKYDQWAKSDSSAEEQAREMLRAWERGDEEVVALWRKMNGWVLDGITTTYEATGIHFDALYYESKTYSSGKEEILRGLDEGEFYRQEDGSVWVDLESEGLDKKILLRSDGTSVYVTQDIGTVIARYNDVPFDRMIYVVGSEQIYHFKVLFHVLRKLGFRWAEHLFHLSYGMVNLPEGKMKSREGTVVDADDLIAELQRLAAEEIREKEREDAVEDIDATAHAIAVGALHYFLLQVSPAKDMMFNPAESLSFTGNTGPYIQYTCARINSMFRKAADRGIEVNDLDPDVALLATDAEWALVRLVGRFPELVAKAGAEYSPSLIAGYLYDVAKSFSGYYHDHPILTAPDEPLRDARLYLSKAVLTVLANGVELLNIPYLDRM